MKIDTYDPMLDEMIQIEADPAYVYLVSASGCLVHAVKIPPSGNGVVMVHGRPVSFKNGQCIDVGNAEMTHTHWSCAHR